MGMKKGANTSPLFLSQCGHSFFIIFQVQRIGARESGKKITTLHKVHVFYKPHSKFLDTLL